MTRRLGLCVLGVGLALLTGVRVPASPRPADAWPQWRGPRGLGIGTGGYPDTWSATERVAWKTAIAGRGHSSPVVWGDRVFLTTSIEGVEIPGRTAPDHLGFDLKPGYLHPDSVGVDHAYTLKVLALDAGDGRLVWERTVHDGPVYDNCHRKNTYASATVVTDGRMVYASFESEGLFAFDVEGNLRWKASFGGMAKAGLGPGTSPILDEGLLTSEDGDTFVIRAGPAHEIIRTNSLDEPVYASPALANGMVFIRGERHLFAIR